MIFVFALAIIWVQTCFCTERGARILTACYRDIYRPSLTLNVEYTGSFHHHPIFFILTAKATIFSLSDYSRTVTNSTFYFELYREQCETTFPVSTNFNNETVNLINFQAFHDTQSHSIGEYYISLTENRNEKVKLVGKGGAFDIILELKSSIEQLIPHSEFRQDFTLEGYLSRRPFSSDCLLLSQNSRKNVIHYEKLNSRVKPTEYFTSVNVALSDPKNLAADPISLEMQCWPVVCPSSSEISEFKIVVPEIPEAHRIVFTLRGLGNFVSTATYDVVGQTETLDASASTINLQKYSFYRFAARANRRNTNSNSGDQNAIFVLRIEPISYRCLSYGHFGRVEEKIYRRFVLESFGYTTLDHNGLKLRYRLNSTDINNCKRSTFDRITRGQSELPFSHVLTKIIAAGII